nr:unnamed protein product [Callosobruchus analis]
MNTDQVSTLVALRNIHRRSCATAKAIREEFSYFFQTEGLVVRVSLGLSLSNRNWRLPYANQLLSYTRRVRKFYQVRAVDIKFSLDRHELQARDFLNAFCTDLFHSCFEVLKPHNVNRTMKFGGKNSEFSRTASKKSRCFLPPKPELDNDQWYRSDSYHFLPET